MRSKALTSKQLASKSARLAFDMKAQDIVILDMRGLVNFCDFFVVATGTSDRQVKAIAQGIDDGLSELGLNAHLGRRAKGLNSSIGAADGVGAWVLLDMGDVVIHLFEPNAREFYNLEHLWQEAPIVAFKEPKKTKLSGERISRTTS